MPATRIKTTHVGSLPRNARLTELIFAKDRRQLKDPAELKQVVRAAVDDVMRRQLEAGTDIPSDGEMSKISYATYIGERLTGFEGDSPRQPPADLEDYPGYLKKIASAGGTPSYKRPQCVGPIAVKTLEPLRTDIRNMLDAMKKHGYTTGFMNSASPGVIALFQPSVYHKKAEDYLQDLAEAMREEYKTIIDSGLMLQIDSPDLALGRHMQFKDKSDEEFLKQAEIHLNALNYALADVPPEQVRLHICWGNYEGPHHRDLEMHKVMPLVVQKAHARTLLFETANPRHAHEWKIWQDMPLRDDHILAPGVIDSTTNFIEHPALVAERLERFVRIFGTERVLASTDCGFATFAGFGKVDDEIVYAKLRSLSEGAALAGGSSRTESAAPPAT